MLDSSGLRFKKSIVDDHLVEAIDGRGSSLAVWSGEDLGYSSHPEKSSIRMYAEHFHQHAKNCCGLYVEHPDEGALICHGEKEASLDRESSSPDVRVLPLVTVAELRHDHRATLDQADKVVSRLGNAITLSVACTTEDYHHAYCELDRASKKLFETQDQCLHSMITRSRGIRDRYDSRTSFRDEDVTSTQKHERMLEMFHTHSDEIRGYVKYISEITSRLDTLTKELSSL